MPARSVRRNLSALVVAACALMLWNVYSTQRASADEPACFAIKNARIVPVSGPPIANGTVVISRGLIQAVGANATIPPEARVIDGTGLTIYPGLIDAGTDVGLGALAAPAAGGGGGRGGAGGGGRGATGAAVPLSMGPEDRPATTPWENAADQLISSDQRMQSWRNSGFTTALVIPRNGIFPGQAAVVDYGEATRAEELVVKSPAALPINITGGRGEYQGYPSALMGQLSYVRQVFIDAQWYAQAQQVYEAHPQGNQRPAYDHTNVAISHALANKELVMWPAETDIQILRALKMAPTLGARWALTGAQQGYEVSDAIAAAHVPVFINVNWPVATPGGGGGGGGGRGGGGDTPEPLRTLRFRDRAPSTPGALNKAGVKIAFMSNGIANPKDILRNISKSITAGLPSDAALRALTLGAAEILGVSDRLGSIEPGKIANLVITDGDIFADATKIKWVFVDGKPFIPPPVPDVPAGRSGVGAAGDLSGNWTLSFTTDQGAMQATASFLMAADGSIGGSITSPYGTAQVTRGQVTGNQFSFTISMQLNGTGVDIGFTGTIAGNQISGTFMSPDGTSVPFTGTKPMAGSEEVRQ